ncbi:hypothetical protein NB636_07300 [Oxalobacter aliiformigenes]|uniref:hypothetical protein n=1 Tax=Oxalobacter aliiformigenes TaxID=2946593 RepID=UPI0022AF2ED4|nr:hypothetical protein [Oxalobacter aliiformigenes]WAV98525.1 hypothetical protein NB636_07300 [Oxalobacter aliiformigenes]
MSEERRAPVNVLVAEKMEDAVIVIPALFREVFVLHYTGSAFVKGRRVFVSNSREGWRVLRISRSTYYSRLTEAWRFVAWELEKTRL